jgi:hypothetical protein
MIRFQFDDRPSFLPDPNDEIYQLEKQVDKLNELTPLKQISLLHNDANNYIMGSIPPFDEWYKKRETAIREYASLNWVGLGNHLNKRRTSLGNMCSSIQQKLQTLLNEIETHKRFQLTVFCSVLAQIDWLWHNILPSYYTPLPEDSTVMNLLKYFNQIS